MRSVVTPEQPLIAELCHRINSPLAAIRNALYLSGCRSQDPDVLRYLQLANEEVSSIAGILREARAVPAEAPPVKPKPAANREHQRHSRRAAA
jgi:two-component sensor histidine kinase